jgi:hypothetical protein
LAAFTCSLSAGRTLPLLAGIAYNNNNNNKNNNNITMGELPATLKPQALVKPKLFTP